MLHEHKPYQEIKVGRDIFWDYSIEIRKVIYEVSINKKTGTLHIFRDENQGG